MSRARRREVASRRAIALWLGTLMLGGCFADPTEVIVVVDTDAKVGKDFDNVQLCFSQVAEANADGHTWPVTVGVRREGLTTMFDVLVKLNTTPSPPPCNFTPRGTSPAPPFASRKAMDVRFVDGEMRVLYLPVLKACACVDAAGMPVTNCPHALDPDCMDLSDPKLGDFDEDNLPHIPASAKSP